MCLQSYEFYSIIANFPQTYVDSVSVQIFSKTKELRDFLSQKRQEDKTIGFVATMGALHYGHMELIRQSREENSITVCSIFVNPTQFNNPKDLEKYPRFIEKDIQMLVKNHCEVLFNPQVKEMYLPNEPLLPIDLKNIDKRFEGEFRPGHFAGVATVVKKFFDIIEPNKAYFGMKDYQQVLVIKEVDKQYKMGVDVVGAETVRNKEGLAMSSRNYRLSEEELKRATIIYQTFIWAKENLQTLAISEIEKQAITKINAVEGAEVEYFNLANANTLDVLEKLENQQVVAITAVNMNGVRLIDNMLLN